MQIESVVPIGSSVKPSGLRDPLRAEHRRLEALFEELQNLVHVGDFALADEAWSRFERGLLAHFEAEEQWMLPVLARRDAEEAAALKHEHDRMRALIAELGVQLEIHVLREPQVDALVDLLRTHAAREDAVLYRLAESALAQGP